MRWNVGTDVMNEGSMFTVGKQNGFGFVCGAALSAFGLTACGAEAPTGGLGEAVASQGQGLVGQACNGSHIEDFVSTGGFVYGPNIATHFCSLTRINGLNGSVRAHAYVDQWNPNWVLVGHGTMSCVPVACFSHPSPNAVTWSQSTYWGSTSGSPCSKHVDMTWADSASSLQGIYNYRAEGAWADTLTHVATVSAFDQCDSNGYMEAYGTSFFVGDPSGDNVEVSPFQSVGSGFFPTAKNLIRVTEGFCYFRNAGYQLFGSSKNVRITHSGTYWVVTGSGSPQPQASAECLYYAQL